jgi:hypothetical protein
LSSPVFYVSFFFLLFSFFSSSSFFFSSSSSFSFSFYSVLFWQSYFMLFHVIPCHSQKSIVMLFQVIPCYSMLFLEKLFHVIQLSRMELEVRNSSPAWN